MKIKLPVTWQVCGEVEVEAESLDDAVAKWDPHAHDLPDFSQYVDGSFELSFNDVDVLKLMQEENKADGT